MTPDEMAALHAAALRVPRPWTGAEFAQILSMHNTFAITVPQGFAIGRCAADEAELLSLAIRPSGWRRGHGTRCLGLYHDAARARGAAISYLEVAETNLAARALYARAGYAECGRRRGYYADGGERVDALVLRRHLQP